MPSARQPHYAVELTLPDGERLTETLISGDAEITLRDFYHLLLDAAGDQFRKIPPFQQWKIEMAAKYNLAPGAKLDDQILAALINEGLITSAHAKKHKRQRIK